MTIFAPADPQFEGRHSRRGLSETNDAATRQRRDQESNSCRCFWFVFCCARQDKREAPVCDFTLGFALVRFLNAENADVLLLHVPLELYNLCLCKPFHIPSPNFEFPARDGKPAASKTF